MPVMGTYDVLNQPPRAVEHRFELAARRIVDAWLHDGRVRASAEDVRLAAEFLKRCGHTAEVMPGLDVRMTSPSGQRTIISREDAVMIALRHLASRPEIAVAPRPEPAPRAPEPTLPAWPARRIAPSIPRVPDFATSFAAAPA
jgi:hypothetical protein